LLPIETLRQKGPALEKALMGNSSFEALLDEAGKNTIGEAVGVARKSLFDSYKQDRSWAAYQHYGDPRAHSSPKARPRDHDERAEPR
jgi:hypothetical protein